MPLVASVMRIVVKGIVSSTLTASWLHSLVEPMSGHVVIFAVRPRLGLTGVKAMPVFGQRVRTFRLRKLVLSVVLTGLPLRLLLRRPLLPVVVVVPMLLPRPLHRLVAAAAPTPPTQPLPHRLPRLAVVVVAGPKLEPPFMTKR